MRKVLLASILLMALLSSCMKGEFVVSDSSLARTVRVRENSGEKWLRLRLALSDNDASYTFILTSPDGDLSWEGALSSDGEWFVSEELLYPFHLSFPEGEYRCLVHSSKGNEASVALILAHGGYELWSLEEASGAGLELEYLDGKGKASEEGEASEVHYSYTDRFGNDVDVRKSLI